MTTLTLSGDALTKARPRFEVIQSLLTEVVEIPVEVVEVVSKPKRVKLVCEKVVQKGEGYHMTQVKVDRVFPPTRVLSSPDESYGTRDGVGVNADICGDGCGSWSKSWAGKTGKHSCRTASNQVVASLETRKRLSGDTYQISLAQRERNRKVSDLSVAALITRRASALAEIEGWTVDLHIYTDQNENI